MCICKNCKKNVSEFIYSGTLLVKLDGEEFEVNVYDNDDMLIPNRDDNTILLKAMELIKRDTGKVGAVKIKSRYFECPNCKEPI